MGIAVLVPERVRGVHPRPAAETQVVDMSGLLSRGPVVVTVGTGSS
jgi:hypothetical protein